MMEFGLIVFCTFILFVGLGSIKFEFVKLNKNLEKITNLFPEKLSVADPESEPREGRDAKGVITAMSDNLSDTQSSGKLPLNCKYCMSEVPECSILLDDQYKFFGYVCSECQVTELGLQLGVDLIEPVLDPPLNTKGYDCLFECAADYPLNRHVKLDAQDSASNTSTYKNKVE